jgi:signal transduction histidine kinase
MGISRQTVLTLILQAALMSGIRQRRDVQRMSRQLLAQQERIKTSEREHAVFAERQRLLQDMHDGIGASLISAIKMMEQGRMQAHEAVAVLRECLDDLRLVIDSLEPLGEDHVTLLAIFRYRLGHRLEQAGVRIDWHMGELPALPWLKAPQALDMLRILQEVFANVIKHSKATQVLVTTECGADGTDGLGTITVRIEDNGIGIAESTRGGGRGLRHMNLRAERLHGSVEIGRTPAGTGVSIRLPIHWTSAPMND